MEPTTISDRDLMSAVEKQPDTYTKSKSNEAADVKKREDAWKTIDIDLNNQYTIKEIQTRYTFGRYLRNAGITERSSVKSSWSHAAFLTDHIEHRSNKENVQLAATEKDTAAEGDTPRTAVGLQSRKRAIEVRKRRPERSSLELDSNNSNTKKTPEVRDKAELFCLSLVPKLRRLNPYNLAMTQIKIIELLTTAEFDNFNLPTQPAPYPYHTPQPAVAPNPSTPVADLLSSLL